MGECSDILNALLEAFTNGLKLTDINGNPITPAVESGAISQILAQLNKLDFDETTSALSVKAVIDAGDLEIGAVELKDSTSEQRAEILLDGASHPALTIRSNELLTTDTFNTVMESIQTLLGENKTALESIQTQTGQLTFPNGVLGVTPRVYKDSQWKDCATEESVAKLLEKHTVSNTIVTQQAIVFSASSNAGTVETLTITPPTELKDIYLISIANLSTESDVNVQLYLTESFTDSTNYWCRHGEAFTVPKSPDASSPGGVNAVSAKTFQVEGAFLANGLAIGALLEGNATNAFNLKITIREKY